MRESLQRQARLQGVHYDIPEPNGHGNGNGNSNSNSNNNSGEREEEKEGMGAAGVAGGGAGTFAGRIEEGIASQTKGTLVGGK